MIEQFVEYEGTIFSLNTIAILMALIFLEASLSADNAVAIATFVREMDNAKHQRRALNWGLVIAFILRIGLLVAATWVIQFWQFSLAGAFYLLWLSIQFFWQKFLSGDRKCNVSEILEWKPTAFLASCSVVCANRFGIFFRQRNSRSRSHKPNLVNYDWNFARFYCDSFSS
jgi:predicted tellurium resistance membrane protein TerC